MFERETIERGTFERMWDVSARRRFSADGSAQTVQRGTVQRGDGSAQGTVQRETVQRETVQRGDGSAQGPVQRRVQRENSRYFCVCAIFSRYFSAPIWIESNKINGKQRNFARIFASASAA